MQLQKDLWIEGAYYLDIDHLGQLRIVGPNNHLHFGTVGLDRDKFAIDEVYSQRGELVVKGRLTTNEIFIHDPVVAHIMKVRYFIDKPGPKPSFEEVVKHNPADLAPNYIGLRFTEQGYQVDYKRLYHKHWYGVKLTFAPGVNVNRSERKRGFNIKSEVSSEIPFVIITEADQKPQSDLEQVVSGKGIDTKSFGKDSHQIDQLLDRTAIEITHLVRSHKTSGFEYGTVFPRDWMESADLGHNDLTAEAVRYMYHKAFEYVSPQGIGWHENVVGEFEFEKHQEVTDLNASVDALIDQSSRIGAALKDLISQVEELYVIRNMVDIEPRYIIGLEDLKAGQFSDTDIERIRRVARYILVQADANTLITFKKIPPILRRHKHDEYSFSGNWRDSKHGFLMVHPVIAPYDVNVVFYPQALRVIQAHAKLLQVDKTKVEALVKKWSKVKDWYRFTNHDGIPGFALALYDVKPAGEGINFKKLEVNHIDEAYDHFYGQPTEEDIINFCRRLRSPNYFYTESGPILVGARDKGYDTTHYHGKVIWTKQTAYVVAGLYKQLKSPSAKRWKASTRKLVTLAIAETALASIKAFLKLGAVPELHYDLRGKPHFYNDQEGAEGPMNMVQLWSAIGARRIIKTYLEVKGHV